MTRRRSPRPPKRRLPRFTDRLALGETGLQVSPFCLGMVRDPDTITAAFDAGINFFFLSGDLHWPYYEASRRGLARLLRRGVRDRVIVAVGTYVTQTEFSAGPLREAAEAVRGLKSLDVGVIAGAGPNEFDARMELFQRLRDDRWLGLDAVGATTHHRPLALAEVKAGALEIAFIRYNPGHSGARTDLFPSLPTPGRTRLFGFKSTWGYFSAERCASLGLDEDHWRPRITDFYRFALTAPAMDGLLCAPRTPAELHALERALDEGPLNAEEEQYLIDLVALDEGRAQLAGKGKGGTA